MTINFGTSDGYWAAHNTTNYTDGDSRTWSCTYSAGNKSSGQAAYSQFGNSSNTCTSLVLTATAGKDMTVTAFSVTMAGASGGNSPTTGTIYLYKRTSGGEETELASADLSGTSNVKCSISSDEEFTSTDILKVSYVGTTKAVRISSLSYSYSTGPSKTPCVDASTITLAPGDFDIKGHTSGTFVADGTKADDGATFTYSTTATSGLTVASDGRYTASAAGSYTVKVTATPSDAENYSSVVKNFDITLTDTRSACGLAYSTSSYDANLGEAFSTPTLTNPNSLSVTYSSSPASVATVNASTGAVTLIKEGEVSITATFAGNDNYKGGTATYTIIVTDPNKKVFDFEQNTEDYGSGVSTTSNGSVYVEEDKTWTNDGIKIKTSGKYRWWDSSGSYTLRFYTNSPQSKMTISAPTGKVITGIAITGGQQFSSDVGAYNSSKGTWAGQATSVVLTYAAASGSVNVKKVTVYVGDPTVTVGSALYTTYTTLIPVSFAGVTAYTVSSISGSSISLTEVTEAPANTPLIIKAAAADTYTLTYKSGAASVGTNLLEASDGTVEGDESTIYALGEKSDVVGFYLVADGVKVPAGKAYLEIAGGSVKEFLTFDFDEGATGINGLTPNPSPVSEGSIYNLAGQKMNRLQRGINIVNGKKLLVK